MSPREWLAVAMFLSFILGILTGFPVAWVLGGIALVFTAVALLLERDAKLDWSGTLVKGRFRPGGPRLRP